MDASSRFFSSETCFNAGGLSEDVCQELVDALARSDVFVYKRERIKCLLGLGGVNATDFTGRRDRWIELFNWYHYQYLQTRKPCWLESALLNYAATSAGAVAYHTYSELLATGWTVKDVVLSSIAISEDNIAAYQPDANEIEHWVRLRRNNSRLFAGALCCGELVGQAGFITLSSREYELLLRGELNEESIEGESYREGNNVYLYIPSVALRTGFRKRGHLYAMLRVLFAQLQHEAYDLTCVKALVAHAYTEDGEQLCRKLGFRFVVSHQDFGNIFATDLAQLSRSKLGARLLGRSEASGKPPVSISGLQH